MVSKGDAFHRQAESDFDVFERLLADARSEVPICHPLHYLQMAVEKLAKALILRDNPGQKVKRHAVLADMLVALRRRDIARVLGYRSASDDYTRMIDSAVSALGQIESLCPQVAGDGRNCEYPWSDDAGTTWLAPADDRHMDSLGLSARNPRVIRLVEFLKTLIRRYPSLP